MQNIKEMIKKENLSIPEERIKFDEPMSKYTSFKIGGNADCLIKIDTKEELQQILLFAKRENIPLTILGNGTNLLASDLGIEGIVIKMNILKKDIQKKENGVIVTVGAGEKMSGLGYLFLREELTGFEAVSAIPGTIGGAVRMNAGAYGKEMKDMIVSVEAMDINGHVKTYMKEELDFSYRRSIFKTNGEIVLEATIELQLGNQEEIKEKMDEFAQARKEKQPLEFPSGGSTFKRGDDYITAQLIDQAGLKGYSIGGAQVSEKHAGFLINKEQATASDMLALIEYVKQTIKDKFAEEIELEIEVIGR